MNVIYHLATEGMTRDQRDELDATLADPRSKEARRSRSIIAAQVGGEVRS